MSIADNVQYVRERISEAAVKSGRDPQDITLVAVTKSTDIAGALAVRQCGIKDMAENRVQLLKEKQSAVTDVNWHLIGHLQTNKVKDVVGKVTLIQSLDSIRLAKEIDRISGKMGVVTDCLCEINIFKEESKSGIYEEDVPFFLDEIQQFENIRIRGLMSMAPVDAEEKIIRRNFSKMLKIYVDNSSRKEYNITMDILSMGMSRDFEYAIYEGANLVRIGRRLFV